MGKDDFGASDAPIEQPLTPAESEVEATIPEGEIASDGGVESAEGEEGSGADESEDADA